MMIKPLIDQLSVQPHGGQVLFPTTSGQSSTQNKNSNCLSDPAPQNVSSPIDLDHANINHSNCQANVSSDSLKINSSVGIEPAIFRPDGVIKNKLFGVWVFFVLFFNLFILITILLVVLTFLIVVLYTVIYFLIMFSLRFVMVDKNNNLVVTVC